MGARIPSLFFSDCNSSGSPASSKITRPVAISIPKNSSDAHIAFLDSISRYLEGLAIGAGSNINKQTAYNELRSVIDSAKNSIHDDVVHEEPKIQDNNSFSGPGLAK